MALPAAARRIVLKRLRTRCLKSADDLEPWRLEQVFVAIRLQVDSGMLWRYLRRRLVDDLLRPAGAGRSQLEHAIMQRAANLSESGGDLYLWWDYILREPPSALDNLLVSVAEDAQLDYSFLAILGKLIRREHLMAARGWLRGDSLPESALRQLGIGPEDSDTSPETTAQQFVLSLCRLIGPGIPIVVCLDQVEALLRTPEDTASLAALGRLVSTLQDNTENVLTVACVQTSILSLLDEAIRDADMQRIAQFDEARLSLLNLREALLIVRSRLDAVPAIKSLRPAGADPIWPLQPSEIESIVGDGCTPRTLISKCSRLLQQSHTAQPAADIAVPQEQVSRHLADELKNRLETAEAPDGSSVDVVLGHVLPWLLENAACDEGAWRVTRDSELPDVDFVAAKSDGEARVGLSIRNEGNMTSLAAHLRRLKSQTDSLQKLVIVRDARAPISETARATHRHLSELEQNDAQLWRPSAELLATLNVIRGLLGESQSGDLACDGTTIGPATLQEWLKQELSGALSSVGDAADTLLRPASPGGFDFEPDAQWLVALTEFLRQRPVVRLDEAADHCGMERMELARRVQEHTQDFALLQGEPQVVFRAVAGGRSN
jgi:hypothetical protein